MLYSRCTKSGLNNDGVVMFPVLFSPSFVMFPNTQACRTVSQNLSVTVPGSLFWMVVANSKPVISMFPPLCTSLWKDFTHHFVAQPVIIVGSFSKPLASPRLGKLSVLVLPGKTHLVLTRLLGYFSVEKDHEHICLWLWKWTIVSSCLFPSF